MKPELRYHSGREPIPNGWYKYMPATPSYGFPRDDTVIIAKMVGAHDRALEELNK